MRSSTVGLGAVVPGQATGATADRTWLPFCVKFGRGPVTVAAGDVLRGAL